MSQPSRHFSQHFTTTGPYPAGELEVTLSDPDAWQEGFITVSVTQDKALDSYNSEFTCEAYLSQEDATQLRDWLTAALEAGS